MYPATIFNWHDNSFINTGEASGLMDDAPLFMQVFSADKGTEDYVEIYGKDFDAMYGKLSFEKHLRSIFAPNSVGVAALPRTIGLM